jgi:hypothetical protein
MVIAGTPDPMWHGPDYKPRTAKQDAQAVQVFCVGRLLEAEFAFPQTCAGDSTPAVLMNLERPEVL